MTLFHRENISFFTASFLLFLVCTSKNILIFNEEILVAISFFSFVLFTYINLQESISEMFQARSDAIQAELQNYLSLKEEFLQELLVEHKKQKALYTLLQKLHTFSAKEFRILGTASEDAFSGVCRTQVFQKLKTLQNTKQGFQEHIQRIFGQGLHYAVLDTFQRSKRKLQPALFKQALRQLAQTK